MSIVGWMSDITPGVLVLQSSLNQKMQERLGRWLSACHIGMKTSNCNTEVDGMEVDFSVAVTVI